MRQNPEQRWRGRRRRRSGRPAGEEDGPNPTTPTTSWTRSGPLLLPLFLLLLCAPGLANAAHEDGLSTSSSSAQCHNENEVCASNSAQVCRNSTCVSVCSLNGMKECICDTEEDNYCYLCCGSEDARCRPAHEQGILRSNGERWERESCARCRMNGAEMEGLACDDRDAQRLCLQGKCSKSVCHDKQQGAFCDRKLEKICVDDVCENPCARIQPHLMVCDCPAIDPDTGFASEDRCQLCCYDFNIKPSSRRCQSAFRKHHIATPSGRPIWRVGLDCAGGKTCNRYGVCSSEAGGSRFAGLWKSSGGRTMLFIVALLFAPALI